MKLTYVRWSMTIVETTEGGQALRSVGQAFQPVSGDRVPSAGRPITIVTDPVFRMLGVPQAPSSYTFARMPQPDLVFVSHSHMDHFEPATLRRLPPGTPVWVPAVMVEKLSGLALEGLRGVEAWESELWRGIRLTVVPAVHSGTELGLIVEGDRTVYFAGDTSLDAELFRAISQRWALDGVFLPIGDLRILGLPVGHIGAKSATRALLLLGQPPTIVPTHYSGMKLFPLVTMPGTPRRLAQAIKEAGLGTLVGTSRPMESVQI